MSRKQSTKATYNKPEIETVHTCMDSLLTTASTPPETKWSGQHEKGNHKQGPQEESSEGAKKAFFTGEESTSSSWEE